MWILVSFILARRPTITVRDAVVSCSNHTYVDNPIAKGFLLGSGSQKVTVPNVTPGSSYFITRK